VSVRVNEGGNSGDPNVKQLRWDYANLSAYREITGSCLKELYDEITELDKCDIVSASSLD